jgi:hypothetical protein
MAASRTTFEKLQRDRAKQAKAAAKRARRLEKGNEEPEEETPIDVSQLGEELSAAQLLDLVEKLHKQFDDEVISFEEFEDQKTELMARLTVE